MSRGSKRASVVLVSATAAVTLLWAEIQMLVLLNAGSEAVVIVTLALTALAVNVAQVQLYALALQRATNLLARGIVLEV